jgi:hypothetical protein
MKTIYKYPLEITDTQEILIPHDSVILDIQFQNDTLCLWALISDTEETSKDKITVNIVGTGNPASHVDTSRYIGTVQQFGGSLVWHVFVTTQGVYE